MDDLTTPNHGGDDGTEAQMSAEFRRLLYPATSPTTNGNATSMRTNNVTMTTAVQVNGIKIPSPPRTEFKQTIEANPSVVNALLANKGERLRHIQGETSTTISVVNPAGWVPGTPRNRSVVVKAQSKMELKNAVALIMGATTATTTKRTDKKTPTVNEVVSSSSSSRKKTTLRNSPRASTSPVATITTDNDGDDNNNNAELIFPSSHDKPVPYPYPISMPPPPNLVQSSKPLFTLSTLPSTKTVTTTKPDTSLFTSPPPLPPPHLSSSNSPLLVPPASPSLYKSSQRTTTNNNNNDTQNQAIFNFPIDAALTSLANRVDETISNSSSSSSSETILVPRETLKSLGTSLRNLVKTFKIQREHLVEELNKSVEAQNQVEQELELMMTKLFSALHDHAQVEAELAVAQREKADAIAETAKIKSRYVRFVTTVQTFARDEASRVEE